jgi:chemotaxis protein CheX
MDPHYIKCFVQSVQNVFSTMLQLPVAVREPKVKTPGGPQNDVSGIIGLSGDVVGTVVLAFPNETAERVVALFCGQKLEVGTPDFGDAVGELVNMVSGGAKALFKDRKCSISCPSVVVGGHHSVSVPSDTITIVIPCDTDCGPLTLEVSIRKLEPATTTTPGATAGARA